MEAPTWFSRLSAGQLQITGLAKILLFPYSEVFCTQTQTHPAGTASPEHTHYTPTFNLKVHIRFYMDCSWFFLSALWLCEIGVGADVLCQPRSFCGI